YALLLKAAEGVGEAELARIKTLPQQAQRVLERALQTDPADRYQTAAEFAQALAPFIAGAHDALGRTMERLFGEDIRAEEARFAAAAAGGAPAAAPGESGATAPGSTKQFAQPRKASGSPASRYCSQPALR